MVINTYTVKRMYRYMLNTGATCMKNGAMAISCHTQLKAKLYCNSQIMAHKTMAYSWNNLEYRITLLTKSSMYLNMPPTNSLRTVLPAADATLNCGAIISTGCCQKALACKSAQKLCFRGISVLLMTENDHDWVNRNYVCLLVKETNWVVSLHNIICRFLHFPRFLPT